MCQIKSGIVLKDKIFCPLDYDSHEDMIKELKLDDTTMNPNFVRVEIIPKDNNVFNHNLDNWQFKVDQDLIPKWFDKEEAEVLMKKELQKWFKERFIFGKKDSINRGRWFLGGSAQVKYIYGSAQVKYIYGSAQVKYICGSAQVENICGSAQVENIGDRAICCFTGKNAKYKTIKDNAMAVLYYKANPEIVVANPKIKLVVNK